MKINSNISHPLLRYTGSKWRISKWVIEHFPKHVTYVEPFAGGASVLLRKEPSAHEVLNDVNDDVVNFFRALRDQPEALKRAIELTPFSRSEHRQSHQLDIDDDLERARRFYILCWQSVAMSGGKGTGWLSNIRSATNSGLTQWNRTNQLPAITERLKRVHIECDDAIKVIKRFDKPDTLFYCDPPYVMSTRGDTKKNIYRQEMTEQDHILLAETLKGAQGMAIVSGYPSDLYNDLYAGWKRHERQTTTNFNRKAIECLWIKP